MYTIDKIYWLVEGKDLELTLLRFYMWLLLLVLDSLVEEKLLTNHKKIFLSSIQNVASNIQIDFNMKKNKFVEKYGHIRPILITLSH